MEADYPLNTHTLTYIFTHTYTYTLIYTEFTQLAALLPHASGQRLGNVLNSKVGNSLAPRFETPGIKEEHSPIPFIQPIRDPRPPQRSLPLLEHIEPSVSSGGNRWGNGGLVLSTTSPAG